MVGTHECRCFPEFPEEIRQKEVDQRCGAQRHCTSTKAGCYEVKQDYTQGLGRSYEIGAYYSPNPLSMKI